LGAEAKTKAIIPMPMPMLKCCEVWNFFAVVPSAAMNSKPHPRPTMKRLSHNI